MKKSLLIGIFGLFVAYVVSSPFITVYKIKSAVDANDSEMLSDYVDFPSVRQSLKDQMNAMVMEKMQSQDFENDPFAALGMAFAGTMIEKMVDAYITPAGMSKLMNEGNKSNTQSEIASVSSTSSTDTSDKKETFEGASMSYKSLSKFEVVNKEQG